MDNITITCNNNGKTKNAEILHRNDKYLKVVLEGTQITIALFREDVNMSYIGHTAGLEYKWLPEN